MFRPHLLIKTGLLLSLGLFLSHDAEAGHSWTAEPVLIHVLAGEKTVIPVDRLWTPIGASDSVAPSLQLLTGPKAITALPFGAPNRLVIDAQLINYGTIPFSYLLERDGQSLTIHSLLEVVPKAQFFSGQWPGSTPPGPPPSEDDCPIEFGAIGRFQTQARVFYLCTDLATSQCQSWPVSEFGSHNPQAVELAYVADWNLDGVDEPALFNTLTGDLKLLDFDSCPNGPCLTVSQTLTMAEATTSVPVWGRWSEADGTPAPGWAIWNRLTQRLKIPGLTPEIEIAGDGGQPLAGDWSGLGFETLGLWQSENHVLHFMLDATGNAFGTFDGQTSEGVFSGRAFMLRQRSCDVEIDYFGVFDPDKWLLSLPEKLISGPGQAIHVKVPVDPPPCC